MQHDGSRRDDATASTPSKRNGRAVQDINHYRFIVRPDKDYTAYFADPDIRLDWATDVLQVILPTSASALSSVALSTIDQPVDNDSNGIPTCPICLSVPTAPRMTKCGHVFCLPCMLHYLALADGTKWRKCPVCWDSVYAKDLKAVRWHSPVEAAAAVDVPGQPEGAAQLSTSPPQGRPATNKETLKMRLIRRPQISTLALPRSPTWPSDAVPALRAPWQFTPDALTYAKFILAPPDYLKAELETNLRDLQQEVTNLRRWGAAGATDDELGIVFVRAAIQKVREQIEEVELLKTSHVMTARKKALRELQAVQDQAGRDARQQMDLPLVSETSSSEVEIEVEVGEEPSEFLGARQLSSAAPAFVPNLPPQLVNGKGRPSRKNVNPRAPDPDSSYYFYQAASGQNIFLHPLDIKILKAHFGTYEGMPDVIEVSVEGADEGTVTEELRKRCRWLSHLPTACDVVFVEADLSRVVPKSALDAYAGPLKQRRNKRRDKARREDRAKVRAEQKEAESIPLLQRSAQYSPSGYSVPLPSSIAALANGPDALQSTTAFPPPASSASNLSASPPTSSTQRADGGTTVWGTRSFASTLHASAGHHDDYAYDDDFDERWHDFEERITRGGGGSGGAGVASGRGNGAAHRNGSASGSNAGGGRAQQAQESGSNNVAANSSGKKKGKKLTLNLTGAAMRGSR
ncbi:hypothetical protein OIV83_002577 [Microbotryomycetes sp. JL201]|nr:hypothetical protein OIV83_002577 [Microbotryomycetes sp. JL201]